jgi:site-specific DNA recombinase
VLAAFQARTKGVSWWKITRELSAAVGIELDERRVQKMIHNRAYLGESKQGKYVKAHAHPPIVDEATWLAAQRHIGRAPKKGRPPLLLAGLVRCGTCNGAMTGNVHGHDRRTYVCRRRIHCKPYAEVSARKLDAYVEGWVLDRLAASGDDVIEAAARDDAPNVALAELETAERLLAEYNSPEVQDAMGVSTWVAGLAAREQRVEDARGRVGEARASAATMPALHGQSIVDVYSTLTHDERRAVMADTIQAVSVDPGRAPMDERVRIVPRG